MRRSWPLQRSRCVLPSRPDLAHLLPRRWPALHAVLMPLLRFCGSLKAETEAARKQAVAAAMQQMPAKSNLAPKPSDVHSGESEPTNPVLAKVGASRGC